MNSYNVIFLILLPISIQKYIYNVEYIAVPLDHFSFSNNITFKLRYLINDSYWSYDGPIFFYTGNEADINIFAQNTGFVWEIASEFQALVVFAEHRYYGESQPFGNVSYQSPEHVGYLTSTQALADFVYLIDFLQKNYGCRSHSTLQSPVIAFGGSYGGMLAAWLRMKYPASVIGAIAASAPILQFGDLIPCDVFNRIVTSVYRTATSYDCAKAINISWNIIGTVTATEEGKKWLSANWKFCKPIKTDEHIAILIEYLQNIYGNMAMVNYPYPTNFIKNIPAYPVKTFCNKLYFGYFDTAYKFLEKLGKALSIFVNNTGTTECMDIFSGSTNLGETGWDFQSCTELVMPMCSKPSDMFVTKPWDFPKYSQDCFDKWKIRVNTEKLAILEYGGRNLHSTSNIIFSNGLLDPWSGGGVLKNISKTVVAYLIPDAAHHLDLRGSHPSDPSSVIAARNFHKNVIKKWLRTYYMNHLNWYYCK